MPHEKAGAVLSRRCIVAIKVTDSTALGSGIKPLLHRGSVFSVNLGNLRGNLGTFGRPVAANGVKTDRKIFPREELRGEGHRKNPVAWRPRFVMLARLHVRCNANRTAGRRMVAVPPPDGTQRSGPPNPGSDHFRRGNGCGSGFARRLCRLAPAELIRTLLENHDSW